MIAVFKKLKYRFLAQLRSFGPMQWLGIFLFLIPLIPSISMQGLIPPDVFRMAWIQLLATLLVVMYFSDVLLHGWLQIKLDQWLVLFVFLFLLYATLSLLWTTNFYQGFVLLLRWLPAVVFGFFVCARWHYFQTIHFVFLAIASSLILVSFLGLLQWYLKIDWFFQHTPPAATFGNKNMSVHFVSVGFPIVLACYLNAKRALSRWIWFVFMLSVLWFLLVTGTRSGFLSVFLSTLLMFVVYGYWQHRQGKKFLFFDRLMGLQLCLAFILILLLFWMNDNSLQALLDLWRALSFQKEEYRLATFLNTLAMIKDHWLLGVGLGGWESIYPQYSSAYMVEVDYGLSRLLHHAHNDWLEVLASLGVIGGTLLLVIVFLMVRRFCYLLSVVKAHQVLFLLGIFFGLFGLGVNALFSFPMMMPIGPLFAFVFLGFLASNIWLMKKDCTLDGKNWSNQKLLGCVWFYVLLVLLISPVSYYLYSRLSSRFFYSQALIFRNDQKANLVIQSANSGLSIKPQDYRFWGLLGDAYVMNQLDGKAIEYYDRFLSFEPNNPQYLWQRAQVLIRLNQRKMAQKDLIHLVEMIPSHIGALKLLVYLLDDHPKIRLFYLYRLAQLSYAKTHLNILANLSMELKDWKKATWALESLLQYNPDSLPIYQNLMAIYNYLGQKEKFNFYQKALESIKQEQKKSMR